MLNLNTIRSEHVGSLMRPPRLLAARQQHDRGEITESELRAVEDSAIEEAIALQELANLDVITDGEFRRAEFSGAFRDNVEGFGPVDPTLLTEPPGTRFKLGTGLVRPLVQNRPLVEDEVAFLIGKTRHPIKATIPAPSTFIRLWYPGVSDKVYPTRDDYLTAVATIIRREVEAIAALGVEYIQVDAPYYAYLVQPDQVAALLGPRVQFDEIIGSLLRADNLVLADLAGVTFGVHMCRGNHSNRYIASGNYEPIAERVFGGLRCSRLLLEFDSPRSGGFEPLRHLPVGTSVALGLVSTKDERLETRDELLARIDSASRYVPIERLAISPQCGFSLVADEPNEIPVERQIDKLRLVGEIAREVWPEPRV